MTQEQIAQTEVVCSIRTYQPDGKGLATTDVDAVRVHLLQLDELVALAQARLTRTLRDEECQKYLHLEQCPEG